MWVEGGFGVPGSSCGRFGGVGGILMTLLSKLQLTDDQEAAVAYYKQCCRAIKDATVLNETQTAKDEVWNRWGAAAQKVREAGLDPELYSSLS